MKKSTKKSETVSSNGDTPAEGRKPRAKAGGRGWLGWLRRSLMLGLVIGGVVALFAVIVALSQQEAALREEVKRLQRENAALGSSKTSHDSEVNSLTAKMSKLEKQYSDLKAQDAESSKILQTMQTDMESLLAENKALKEASLGGISENQKLRSELNEKSDLLQKSKGQIKALTEKSSMLESELEAAIESERSATEHAETTRTENLKLREVIESSQEQLKEMKTDHEGEIKQLKSEMASTQDQTQDTQKDDKIEKLEEELAATKRELLTVIEAQKKLKPVSDKCQGDLNDVEGQRDALSRASAQLQQEVALLKKTSVEKDKEIDDLHSKVELDKQAIAEISYEAEQVNTKLESLQQLKKNADRDLQTVRDEAARKSRDVSELTVKVTQIQAEKEEVGKEVGMLSEKLQEVEEVGVSLREEMAKLASANQALESKVKRLNAASTEAKQVAAQLRGAEHLAQTLATQLAEAQEAAKEHQALNSREFGKVSMSALKSSPDVPIPAVKPYNLANFCRVAQALLLSNDQVCLALGQDYATFSGDGKCRGP